MSFKDHCDFFGCLRPKITVATPNDFQFNGQPVMDPGMSVPQTIVITVDGVDKTIKPCAYHLDIIQNGDPTQYSIGSSFAGDPEIRLHPAPPA